MLKSIIVGSILSLFITINAYSQVNWIIDSVNVNSKEHIQQEWANLLGWDIWMVYFKVNDIPTNLENKVVEFFGFTNSDWSLSLKLKGNRCIFKIEKTF
jgi:hypothetical protein